MPQPPPMPGQSGGQVECPRCEGDGVMGPVVGDLCGRCGGAGVVDASDVIPMDRCAECGVEAHNGVGSHPPLCEKCVPIWYPTRTEEDDGDCRDIA